MFLLIGVLLSAAQGWLFGSLYGLDGLFISIPIALIISWFAGELDYRRF